MNMLFKENMLAIKNNHDPKDIRRDLQIDIFMIAKYSSED